ncbi:NUDIX hydrolase [Planococcus sp. CP5-4]|uniref:NUDIX hydrolase n=1 Tax=unclassified Planococcus (in: firmicutes) TaxID=2662419 RepID=UPI001C2240C3|nr:MULTISPECIES: NUDIX hydrolase [unclassified Planococcus (in: firmicutes)]MBU9675141.1 NUDIX hydrolase [Planococcus sp. CP5-4_YE]MBV0910674.1 NUDIX hydrolase [Planococcus sp. CP5-4_UN]MBW6065456.1 NUDIX hydrolase [Planococcus sp. CP5-4]
MAYIENLRKVVGRQPLILAGVAVAVVNDMGEFLLQKRMDGKWGVPGGFIELGESTEEAGRREVLEETGIQVGKLKLVGVFSGKEHYVKLPNGDEFYPVTTAYVTNEIKGGSLTADGIETTEAKFFDVEELPSELNPLIKNLIKQYSLSFSS